MTETTKRTRYDHKADAENDEEYTKDTKKKPTSKDSRKDDGYDKKSDSYKKEPPHGRKRF